MTKHLVSIFSAALLCGVSLAQEANAPAENKSQQAQPQAAEPQASQPAMTPAQTNGQSAQNPRIAPGSVIPVQLIRTIDAKKAKTGDEVDARVTQDLKSNNGELIVPKDTKVVGHVTDAQARGKEQKESQVSIVFDHAVMKGGDVVSLPMSIQAIISPQALGGGNNSGDTGGAYSSPSASSESSAGSGGGGRPGMAGGGSSASMPRPQTNPAPSGETADQTTGGGTRPPITANTQGVVGISDVRLSTAGQTAQGSVVSSEKNNVKLENGTLMLLRVNQ